MNTIESIKAWQELIGSALGPFLAVIFSAIGFWIKSIYEVRKERKESFRRIEISLANALNDAYFVSMKLEWFSRRIQKLIDDSKSITGNIFFLNRINFPTIREIYRDEEMTKFKINSYYLVNKIMWIDAAIKEMNETVKNLRRDFEDITRQNEIQITLMKDNPDPLHQRESYETNLQSFAKAIDDHRSISIKSGTKIMMQIKLYNDKLRKRYGGYFLWKHEGTSFIYFRNKAAQIDFAGSLASLKRIDKLLQNDVDILTKNIEKRSRKSVQN